MFTAIIPAKKKSRRLPNKNWRPFNGPSLAIRKLQQAAKCTFDRVVLSLEAGDTLNTLERLSIGTCPSVIVHKRPRRFREMSSIEVVLDVLDSVGSFGEVDAYALLQPTSPLVTTEHIMEMMALVSTSLDNVVAVNPAYKPCGAFYGGLVRHLRKYRTFYPCEADARAPKVRPFVLDWKESIDIDYDYDFDIARGLL